MSVEIKKMLEQVLLKLELMEKSIRMKSHEKHLNLIDNHDFIQLFKISERTAVKWRKIGLIKHKKVMGKIYYSMDDIDKLINNRTTSLNKKIK